MTFRAKPVVKRSHKPSWESQDRRNLYLNIGFGIVVVSAVAILLIAAGLSYYNDHLVAGRQRQRPVDHDGRVQGPLRHRDAPPGGGRAPDPHRVRRRPADRSPDERPSCRPSTPSASRSPTTTLERIIDQDLQAEPRRPRKA